MQSTIINAQAQAKSAELIGEAARKNPVYLQLKKIEIAKDIARIISESNNQVFLKAESLLLDFKDIIAGK